RPVDLIGCRAGLRFFPGAVHMALAVEDCTIFDNQSGCINIAVDSPRGTYLDLGFRGNAALDRAADLHCRGLAVRIETAAFSDGDATRFRKNRAGDACINAE